jgi:hypothetical protein
MESKQFISGIKKLLDNEQLTPQQRELLDDIGFSLLVYDRLNPSAEGMNYSRRMYKATVSLVKKHGFQNPPIPQLLTELRNELRSYRRRQST